jgi:hypothetical protein
VKHFVPFHNSKGRPENSRITKNAKFKPPFSLPLEVLNIQAEVFVPSTAIGLLTGTSPRGRSRLFALLTSKDLIFWRRNLLQLGRI